MSYITNCFLMVIAVSLAFLGTVAYAHGGESMEMRHAETQIGLPGSIMSSDEMIDDPSGMTREEVAHMIESMQKPEESRILFKLIILSLSIAGLIYLYYPRKAVLQPAKPSDVTPPQALNTEVPTPSSPSTDTPVI